MKIPHTAIGLPEDSIFAPGAAILSTPNDTTKWLAFLVRTSNGMATDADKSVIARDTLQEILRSRVISTELMGQIPVKAGYSYWEELSVPAYALAQVRGHYRGIDISSHNGRDAFLELHKIRRMRALK